MELLFPITLTCGGQTVTLAEDATHVWFLNHTISSYLAQFRCTPPLGWEGPMVQETDHVDGEGPVQLELRMVRRLRSMLEESRSRGADRCLGVAFAAPRTCLLPLCPGRKPEEETVPKLFFLHASKYAD
ncbi:hypothetical protein BGZ94_006160, partial [Podila epigama]